MILEIEITETEFKAMQYIAFSVQDWVDNVITNRARIAIEEIVQLTVQQCLSNNIQIPGTKDGMVELAFEQGWIKSAADRQAELETQTVPGV